jgi:hypothetical protein
VFVLVPSLIIETFFTYFFLDIEKGKGEQKVFLPLQHDGDFKPAQHSRQLFCVVLVVMNLFSAVHTF